MRFSSKTGLKLDKSEARRLKAAHLDLADIGRITNNGVAQAAARSMREALVSIGVYELASPSGDTSDPMPPSQQPKK